MNVMRQNVAALFKEQAESLRVKIVAERAHAYLYEVEIDGERYLATVLAQSRHYYDFRFNLTAPHITLLVVYTHNTWTKHPVLALDEGYLYAPFEPPRWYSPNSPRTRKNAMVLVGGLLCGVDEAYQQLQRMKRQTRSRYLTRMSGYLKLKQGRYVAIPSR
jgi:hypothetical protein